MYIWEKLLNYTVAPFLNFGRTAIFQWLSHFPSPQPNMRVPIFPYPWQHLLLFILFYYNDHNVSHDFIKNFSLSNSEKYFMSLLTICIFWINMYNFCSVIFSFLSFTLYSIYEFSIRHNTANISSHSMGSNLTSW